MLEWIQDYRVLLYWVGGACLVLFIVTLVLAPMLIVRIPPDYFTHSRRPPGRFARRGRGVQIAVSVLRNALGVLCILAGLAMLALPGQGLLTLLVGFLLVEFPRKYRLEQWVVSRRRVLGAINWLRRRRGRAPLVAGAG